VDLTVEIMHYLCTFLDLVNTCRQIWSFLLILYRLLHLLFTRIHRCFFRPPTKTMNRGFTVYSSDWADIWVEWVGATGHRGHQWRDGVYYEGCSINISCTSHNHGGRAICMRRMYKSDRPDIWAEWVGATRRSGRRHRDRIPKGCWVWGLLQACW
jgi:hypothetical protein